MPKRVLVLSASVGAGHLRAAQGVELALRHLAPDAIVENIDVLQLTNGTFRRLYSTAYLDLVNRAPHMLGYFYDVMDRAPSNQRKADRLRLLVEKLNLRPLVKFLLSKPRDLIINTHFLPAEIIASLRRRHALSLPHFTVTTDFETHRLWVNQPCDRYFTATGEGAAYLAHWGVPETDIRVTGIPLHPAFHREHDRAECLARQGLVGDRPILLQLAGGFGVGPIAELFKAVLAVRTPLEIVAVAGRNDALRVQLELIEPPERHRVKIIGFTTDIDELMAVAGVVMTKPGGLTTSEALASGAAMAIVNPIPGQESRNSDYLLENGAAVKINNIGTLAYKLEALLNDGDRLRTLRENARQLGRPGAALEIARQALDHVAGAADRP
jgi:processive 1,2-diacylglycerol beta-glucosyltransferase